jgi:hypothetical protein
MHDARLGETGKRFERRAQAAGPVQRFASSASRNWPAVSGPTQMAGRISAAGNKRNSASGHQYSDRNRTTGTRPGSGKFSAIDPKSLVYLKSAVNALCAQVTENEG